MEVFSKESSSRDCLSVCACDSVAPVKAACCRRRRGPGTEFATDSDMGSLDGSRTRTEFGLDSGSLLSLECVCLFQFRLALCLGWLCLF